MGCVISYFSGDAAVPAEGQLTEKLLPPSGEDAKSAELENKAGPQETEQEATDANETDPAADEPATPKQQATARTQHSGGDDNQSDGATDDEHLQRAASGAGTVAAGAIAGALKTSQITTAEEDLIRDNIPTDSPGDGGIKSTAAADEGTAASDSAENTTLPPNQDKSSREASPARKAITPDTGSKSFQPKMLETAENPVPSKDLSSKVGQTEPVSQTLFPNQTGIETQPHESALQLTPTTDISSGPLISSGDDLLLVMQDQSPPQSADVTTSAQVVPKPELEADDPGALTKASKEADSKGQEEAGSVETSAHGTSHVSQEGSTGAQSPKSDPVTEPDLKADALLKDSIKWSQNTEHDPPDTSPATEVTVASVADDTLPKVNSQGGSNMTAMSDSGEKAAGVGGSFESAATPNAPTKSPTQKDITTTGLSSRVEELEQPNSPSSNASVNEASDVKDQPCPGNTQTPLSAARTNDDIEVFTPEVVAVQRPTRQQGSDEWNKLELSSEPAKEGKTQSVPELGGLQGSYDELEKKALSADDIQDGGVQSRAQSSVGAVVGSTTDLQQEQNILSPAPSVQEDVIVKVDRFGSQDEDPKPAETVITTDTEANSGGGSTAEALEAAPEQINSSIQIPSKDSENIADGASSPLVVDEIKSDQVLVSSQNAGEESSIDDNQNTEEIVSAGLKDPIVPTQTRLGEPELLNAAEDLNHPESIAAGHDASEHTEDIDYDPLAVTQSVIFPDELTGGRASTFSEKPTSPFPVIQDSNGNLNSLSDVNLQQTGPVDSLQTLSASPNEETGGTETGEMIISKLAESPPTTTRDAETSLDEAAGVSDAMSTSEAAATKIQAGVRGWQVRRKISQQNAAATQIQAGYRGWKVRREKQMQRTESLPDLSQKPPDTDTGSFMDVSELKNRAASKIQAGFRGWKTRQEMKGNKGETCEDIEYLRAEDAVPGAGTDISPAISMSNVSAEDQAAAKIQAGYRGWKTRKTLHRSLSDPNSEALVLAPVSHEQATMQESNGSLHDTTPAAEVTPREEDETAHSIQSIQSEVASTPREGHTEQPSPSSDAIQQGLDDAAVKIQAGYRGWKARQDLQAPGDLAERGDAVLARAVDSAKSVTDSGALPIDYAIVHRPEDDWVTSELQKLDAQKAAEEDSDSASSWLSRAQSDIRASFQGLRDNMTDALRTVEETAGLAQEAEGAAPLKVHPDVATVADKGAAEQPSETMQQMVAGAEGDMDSKEHTISSDIHYRPEALEKGTTPGVVQTPSEKEEQDIWEEIKRNMDFDDLSQ